jgi:hypothetical protein
MPIFAIHGKNKTRRDEMKIIACGVVFLLVLGCATLPTKEDIKYEAIPETQTAINEFYEARLTPRHFVWGILWKGWTAFQLTILNKTGQDLELDWNRTLFIHRGETKGGFMFEGVVYKDRNNPKPPDIIFANSNFSKIISPNSLVQFSSGIGWFHEGMGLGEHGVLLSIKAQGREIRGKLTIRVVEKK